MNELEQTLQKILEKSIEMAEKTGDFVIEQGTDLLQQFFVWHTIEHTLGILLGIFILIISILTPKLWGSNKSEYDSDVKLLGKYYDADDGSSAAAYTFYIVGIIASSWVTFAAVYKLIFIIAAPKLYLLEYFF